MDIHANIYTKIDLRLAMAIIFFARRKTLSYQPITSQQRKMPVN